MLCVRVSVQTRTHSSFRRSHHPPLSPPGMGMLCAESTVMYKITLNSTQLFLPLNRRETGRHMVHARCSGPLARESTPRLPLWASLRLLLRRWWRYR